MNSLYAPSVVRPIARPMFQPGKRVILFLLCLQVAGSALAQAAAVQAGPADPAADVGWPRLYKAMGHEVVLHEPQVDKWEKYERLTFRAAIVIRKEGAAESVIGSLRASAPTSVDLDARTVFIGPRKVEALSFGKADAAEVDRLKKIMLAALPDEKPMTISLDRVFALVQVGGDERHKEAAGVNLDPPPIYASQTPAVLVMLAGKPRFEKVEGTKLMFAANTNWDLFLDSATAQYYLLNGDHWLTTGDLLKGQWTAVKALPADLFKLPDTENWKDVKQNIPGKPPKMSTTVIVTTGPAELIVTEGKPTFEPIPGTKLMAVNNTDSDLFMHMTEQQYYLLAAGRWFRAKELAGPWTAATTTLPADFAAIPANSEAAEVLASVPGTEQAQAAVLQASTPRKATINRADVKVTVTYIGEPQFVEIPQTTLKYAINSPFKVFWADGQYYCCDAGVWFVSSVPAGPWAVAVAVPPAIYTIPPSHPSYNVTYVYVYESTPTTVVVGSTAGYSGQYVANGVVLFGAGMIVGAMIANNNDQFWHCHYSSAHFSYGCGAHYSHYHGGYYSKSVSHYGPYGGAGAWSAYNPSTGVVSRGATRYGPAGSASVRTAYNPWTGNSAGRATASTPYGSYGRSAVTNGEDWARGGYNSTARGTVAGFQTSEGAGAVAAKGQYGNGAVVAKDKDGDVYVGKNGEAYKRDDSGSWSQRDGGEWKQPEGKPSSPRPQSTSTGAGSRNTNVSNSGNTTNNINVNVDNSRTNNVDNSRTANTARTSSNSTYQDLDRQAQSRDRSASSSQQASQRTREPSAQPSRSKSSGGRKR